MTSGELVRINKCMYCICFKVLLARAHIHACISLVLGAFLRTLLSLSPTGIDLTYKHVLVLPLNGDGFDGYLCIYVTCFVYICVQTYKRV
jgi:hypothetical protein